MNALGRRADKITTEIGEKLVEIVTRAQTNTVGYTVPELLKTKIWILT